MIAFLSSVIAGFESYRQAAGSAIDSIGQLVRAEDFGARPDSPQQACLAGVRKAQVLVLVLGSRYGDLQASGLSATDEEYQEAVREGKSILVFIQESVDSDSDQQAFIQRLRGWASGFYLGTFRTEEDLHKAVIRALHNLELESAGAPGDPNEALAQAREALPRGAGSSGGTLALAAAPLPRRAVIRPHELSGLASWLMQQGMFGQHPVLEVGEQTQTEVVGRSLRLQQRDRTVSLTESGLIVLTRPALPIRRPWTGLPAVIHEDVIDWIERGLLFALEVLKHLDPELRLTSVVPVARLAGATAVFWRTRAEHEASPNSAPIFPFGSDLADAYLDPPSVHRAALGREAGHIAADLTELLARSIRAR